MQIKKWHILMSLSLGLMLGFFIQQYVASQPSGLIPVVVAGTDISAGTVLRPENLQIKGWPQDYLPTNTAEKVNQVEGLIITQPVAKGEPVLLPKLAQPVSKEVL
jgi:Flp pilus assembly protein CpaB